MRSLDANIIAPSCLCTDARGEHVIE